jgi:hypothetical protein
MSLSSMLLMPEFCLIIRLRINLKEGTSTNLVGVLK